MNTSDSAFRTVPLFTLNDMWWSSLTDALGGECCLQGVLTFACDQDWLCFWKEHPWSWLGPQLARLDTGRLLPSWLCQAKALLPSTPHLASLRAESRTDLWWVEQSACGCDPKVSFAHEEESHTVPKGNGWIFWGEENVKKLPQPNGGCISDQHSLTLHWTTQVVQFWALWCYPNITFYCQCDFCAQPINLYYGEKWFRGLYFSLQFYPVPSHAWTVTWKVWTCQYLEVLQGWEQFGYFNFFLCLFRVGTVRIL